MLTKNGAIFGPPLAAYALKFAVEHDHSMCEYFGTTNSSGETRAPYNRIQIIENIRDGSRIADLIRIIYLNGCGIRQHLKQLEKL